MHTRTNTHTHARVFTHAQTYTQTEKHTASLAEDAVFTIRVTQAEIKTHRGEHGSVLLLVFLMQSTHTSYIHTHIHTFTHTQIPTLLHTQFEGKASLMMFVMLNTGLV